MQRALDHISTALLGHHPCISSPRRRRYNRDVTEPTQDRFTLRQADAARADLYAIHDELDFIKVQLARLPTRRDMARVALIGVLAGAAPTVAVVALLGRGW